MYITKTLTGSCLKIEHKDYVVSVAFEDPHWNLDDPGAKQFPVNILVYKDGEDVTDEFMPHELPEFATIVKIIGSLG